MSIRIALLALVMIAALPLIPSAGTITLTGTCTGAVSNQATLWFSLINTGNEGALGLVIQPHLHGFATNSAFYNVGLLAPGKPVNYTMSIYGNVLYGSYPEWFVVTYNQSASQFSAVFPCLVAVGQPSASAVAINSIQQQGNILRATIQNNGALPENLTLYGIAPPSFNITKEVNMSIQGYQETNVSFAMRSPNNTGSYTVAVALSYRQGNRSYAALSTYVVSFNSLSSPSRQGLPSGLDTAETFIVVVIAVILALLVISVFKKKDKR